MISVTAMADQRMGSKHSIRPVRGRAVRAGAQLPDAVEHVEEAGDSREGGRAQADPPERVGVPLVRAHLLQGPGREQGVPALAQSRREGVDAHALAGNRLQDDGARASGSPAEILEIGARDAAISWAIQQAQPGDCVIILGKGHETGQEVAGVVTHFDDREVARAALEGRVR